jgi:hypothetical protein
MWVDFMEGSLETKLFFIDGTRNPTASQNQCAQRLQSHLALLPTARQAQRAHTAHAPEFAVLHRNDADVAAASPA